MKYALAATAALAMVASAAMAKDVRIVTLAGIPWRVTMKKYGADVEPRRMTIFRSITADYMFNAKKAAEQATGCKAGDATSFRMRVYVLLDCSKQSQ